MKNVNVGFGPSRVDEFLERLALVAPRDEDQIWSLCMNEIQHLKTAEWQPLGVEQPRRFGYTLYSLRSVLRNYRNAIRSDPRLGSTHLALKFLRPSNADQGLYKTRLREQLYRDQSKLRPIEPGALLDVAEGLLRVADIVHPFQAAAGLVLVTGRRPWEIGCTALFKRGRGQTKIFAKAGKRTLLFDGQAKTRGSLKAKTKPYEIPVLLDRELILWAFETVRMNYNWKGIASDVAFNRYAGKEILRHSRELFRDYNGRPLTAKDLRSAYAAIADHWYRPRDVATPVLFSRALGHGESQTDTALAYLDFYIVGQKRSGRREQRQVYEHSLAILDRMRRSATPKAAKDIENRIQLLEQSRLSLKTGA